MTSYTMGYTNVRGKERRKDRRLPLPIFTVRLDGQTYHTINWSLGGLLVEGYTGERQDGDAVEIDIKAKDTAADFRMHIGAKVVRVIPNESLSLQFEAMSPALYEFFERCFAARFEALTARSILSHFLENLAAGPLDWLALVLFVVAIFGYGRFADRSGTANLNAHMRHVRRRWMLRYLERDDRVLDAIFTGHSMNSISLFASATLLVVVALLGLLGNSDLAYRLATQSTFVTNTTGAMFQVKLMGVICVFIYGFYRFTWALLQYNYLLALTASAPLTGDLTPETAKTMAAQLSVVLNAAVTSFHSGFRTYYYALAWVGWFFHPIVFMVAILFVTFILVYRQIHSPAAGAIADYAATLENTDGKNRP